MKTLFPKDVYDKFLKGSSLTDVEVNYGARYFNELGDMLVPCGPAFSLAAKEAHRVGRALEEFQIARKRNKKPEAPEGFRA